MVRVNPVTQVTDPPEPALTIDDRPPQGTETPYQVAQATPEFQELRHTLRRFVFPATVAFLTWYTGFVLLTLFARDFMAQELLGKINVAYVLGMLQFVSTFVIAYVYAKYAEKNFDPLADKIRERLEAEEAAR